MGMFDFVRYTANCEKCGEPLKDFQSKDGECLLKVIRPDQEDYFYSICEKCHTWHDFTVDRVCIVRNIEVQVKKGY